MTSHAQDLAEARKGYVLLRRAWLGWTGRYCAMVRLRWCAEVEVLDRAVWKVW